MYSRWFLLVGGALLAIVGLLGFFGVIGPTPEQSIFGSAWYFDNGENWAHLLIGVAAIIIGFTMATPTRRSVTLVLGIIGVLFGIYSIFFQQFLGTNLENPADTLLHLGIGAWALLSAIADYPSATVQRGEREGRTRRAA